jgi:ferric-dicitrate binding protein FerR (iron transport regulator)
MTDWPRQIDRYLDGDLSNREIVELFEWVGADADNAGTFARQCLLDEHAQELLQDGLATGTADRQSLSRHRWVKVAAYASAATILIALGLVVWQVVLKPEVSPVAPPAVIAQSIGAYDAEGNAFRPGQEVVPGPLAIDRGVLRLDFSSGAQVAVEGPATLEILDEMHIILGRGVATATVPDSAIGFSVDTSAARIVDKGTDFGVSVGDDGLTEVCVFDGEVEVDHHAAGSTSGPPLRVVEGQAVRASRASSTIDPIDFETSRYERAWPVSSGVLQTTGLMKFVSPGPEFVPGRYEDTEHIIVFAEQKDVLLEKPLPVNLAEPGEYERLRRREQHVLQPGQRVRSYLLQLDPVGRQILKGSDKPRVFGQITFDSPIVGLIASQRNLSETDALFGDPEGDYGDLARGVEPSPEDLDGKDAVILAADRRTLILNLAAASAVDQIRVLVSEKDKGTTVP